MNICIVSKGFPTYKTIDFIFVDQLCRVLADKGEHVSVIAPQSITKILFRHIPMVKRKQRIWTRHNNFFSLYRPLYISLSNFKSLRKLNRVFFNKSVSRAFNWLDQKPDVCYGHFWDAVYAILKKAQKNNIPLIASSGEEVITINTQLSKFDFSKLVNYVSGVISVSTKNKKENISAGLTDINNCIVIPNGIDSTLFFKKDKTLLRSQFGYSQKDIIVAFVGQFTHRKGIDTLSKSLEFINDDRIKALFIGSGPITPTYKNCLHIGSIPHDSLPDYLNCADLFVLPTLNEGCSNAIIEAMACGLPIISSDSDFNYDILNNENSILVNAVDFLEVADAIKSIINDSQLMQQLSEGSLRSSYTLSLDHRAEKVLDYIKQSTSVQRKSLNG